ncbi:MAG: AAA family ATPase [Janthinobacterium lividum]
MAAKPTSPPPAYFLSLSLENVRSFGEKQTISFARKDGRPAQWTIILGDNGVGKTTVLKSLAVMRPSSVYPLKYPDGEEVYQPVFFADRREEWIPSRSSHEGAGYISVNYDFGIDATHSQEIPPELWKNHYLSFRVDESGKYSGGGCSVYNIIHLGIVVYAYGAGRTTGNSTLSETPEAADTCASLFDDRADLLNPEEWFLNIDYGSKLAGSANTQLADARDRVEKMLIDVLPGVTKIQIAAAGTPQKPQISLQFLLHDTWVRLRDMSLGYQTLVVWLTDLASKLYVRYPESDNPLVEPAIVLIDEIDLHLHPKWQRELLSVLSGIFPETQFIATAHSPLIVQAATDAEANVVLLRREGDQTIVVPDLEDVRNWRIDQIMTSELFGFETARSPEAERMLKRRTELLNQLKLTAADKKELAHLTKQLGLENQPVGETPSEKQVHTVLQQLRQKLGAKPTEQGA